MSHLLEVVHKYPINIVSGSAYSSKVKDENGVEYYDFWGDEGVNSLGNGGGKISWILKEHAMSGNPLHIPKMFGDYNRENLAEFLVENSGISDGKVIYSNSGTEANEAAIKLARLYWYKRNLPYKFNIAVKKGNFHGRTGFSLAASDSSDSPYHKLGFGPMPVGFYVWDTIGELENLMKMAGGVAAVMMAPILGNNCIEIYSDEFMEDLQKMCWKYRSLIIFDEVQVSMGRTGHMMGYQNYHGLIKPDIATIGKGIAAGLPLSATIVSEDVAEAFGVGAHFNTFGGNSLACKMAIEVMKYLTPKVLNEISIVGINVKQMLNDFSFVKSVHGRGYHLAFQSDFDKLPYDGIEFCEAAMGSKLLICTHRKFGQIRFTPPISTPRYEIYRAVDILKRVHILLLEKYNDNSA